jgi:hypothetical protein
MSGGIGGVGNGFSWNFFASKPEVVIQKRVNLAKKKVKFKALRIRAKEKGSLSLCLRLKTLEIKVRIKMEDKLLKIRFVRT